MIGHCLLSNNEMCYSIKIQIFSPTKHTLRWERYHFRHTADWHHTITDWYATLISLPPILELLQWPLKSELCAGWHPKIRTITAAVLRIFVQCHDSNSKEESMQEQLKTIDAQYFQRLNYRPLPIYPLLSNSI